MHVSLTGRSFVLAGFAILLGSPGLRAAAPLIEAAKKADLQVARTLTQGGADVNAREGDGSTALQWAAYADNPEIVDLLIRSGADVNVANDLGATALWAASQNGNSAIVRRLLEAGADPNVSLLAGETPLMTAARSGFPEIVELLLQEGADPNRQAARGQTALMWAASQSHPEAVKALLARGADVHLRTESWGEMMAVPPHGFPGYNRVIPHGDNTALLFAARSGDLASAKLLVDAGANVNDVDAWGVSATVLAAHSGFGEFVEYLLAQGADPNLAAAGFGALHIAILRRDEKMARDLLSHGADPNAPVNTWTPTRRSSKDFHFQPELVGSTPYWLAARFRLPATMRLLAARGADPLVVHTSESIGSDGLKWPLQTERTTALMAALGIGGGSAWVDMPQDELDTQMLAAIKTAVELGADLNAVSASGKTALELAVSRKYESVAAFLREKGARQTDAASAPQAVSATMTERSQ